MKLHAICPPDETPEEPEHILLAVTKWVFGANRLKYRRSVMDTSICCKELGIVCDYIIEGETGEIVIEALMRHVKEEHTDDWYEIEEIYQAACSVARAKAA
jgi:hypothetical protein